MNEEAIADTIAAFARAPADAKALGFDTVEIHGISVGSVGLSGDFFGSFQGQGSQPASLDGLVARMARGEFDLVAVGRALLSDPQ